MEKAVLVSKELGKIGQVIVLSNKQNKNLQEFCNNVDTLGYVFANHKPLNPLEHEQSK